MTKAEAEKLRAKGSNRRGLGVAPFCLPEKSIVDRVTHAELQRELRRLRSAVAVIANRLGANVLSADDFRELTDLLKEPADRRGEENG